MEDAEGPAIGDDVVHRQHQHMIRLARAHQCSPQERTLRKIDPAAPHNTLLVLDATTGQNALSQVEIFRKIADVSGLVMTKLDGTAKGGVLVALADRFGLPIHAIGVGEQIDDLAPFDPDDFARALVGLDT